MVLGSWSCLCRAVLRHSGGGCLSTTLHRHDQVAKYHPVPNSDDIISVSIKSFATEGVHNRVRGKVLDKVHDKVLDNVHDKVRDKVHDLWGRRARNKYFVWAL